MKLYFFKLIWTEPFFLKQSRKDSKIKMSTFKQRRQPILKKKKKNFFYPSLLDIDD